MHTHKDTNQHLQSLFDKEAIRQLMLCFCRGVDRRDIDLVKSVFWPDAREDHGFFIGDTYEYLSTPRLGSVEIAHHMVGQTMIDLKEDEAFCETYYNCGVILRPTDQEPSFAVMLGRYLDKVQRRNGEWRIFERLAVSDITQQRALSRQWDMADRFVQGIRGPTDPVFQLESILSRLHQRP